MTGFTDPDAFSYLQFEQRIKKVARHILDDTSLAFLIDKVAPLAHNNVKRLGASDELWRCRAGSIDAAIPMPGIRPFRAPHPIPQLKPIRDAAFEGRLNPKGIPVLYLASDMATAVSEMRAAVGQYVTVAPFQPVRELVLANFSRCRTEESSIPSFPLTLAYVLSHAFSRPVERADNAGDYAATQVVAEWLKLCKFDGVAYNSAVASGINYALFDLDSADVSGSPKLLQIKAVNYVYE